MRSGLAPLMGLGVALLAAATGCVDALLAPEPDADPVSVARAAWMEIEEYHPFFERTGLDWDAVGAAHLSRVSAATSDAELFVVLSEMIAELRDGHAGLQSPGGAFGWDGWHAGRPENVHESLLGRYLRPPSGASAGGAVRWGALEGGLGYLRISTFGGEGVGSAVDQALGALGPVSGLVVDVRSNGGGSDTQSDAAAGRLVGERTHYRTVRYKAGPAHDDFGPDIRDFIGPSGEGRYAGPVVVLQNKRVFSAAESFVLAMRVRPGVTFVGDSTGGGSGNPIARELPNHWVLRVSRWQAWAADGTWYEGLGLAPDVLLDITDADVAAGRDVILERAIELLGGGAG